MPKRITVAPHLPPLGTGGSLRQAKDPVERSHYQIIWLLAQGKPSEQVASVTGYSRIWIYELVRGITELDLKCWETYVIKTQVVPHCLMMCNKRTREQALQGLAPDGGQWTWAESSRGSERVNWSAHCSATGVGVSQADAHATVGTSA